MRPMIFIRNSNSGMKSFGDEKSFSYQKKMKDLIGKKRTNMKKILDLGFSEAWIILEEGPIMVKDLLPYSLQGHGDQICFLILLVMAEELCTSLEVPWYRQHHL